LITFLSPEIATSTDIHVSFSIITDCDVRFMCWGWICRCALVDSTVW
jgi:hypothetical protein